MIGEQWGTVVGDGNAEAIINDRRDGLRLLIWVRRVLMLGLIACLFWVGSTGSSVALAFALGMLWLILDSSPDGSLYATHTMVMITERRAQLLEQQVLTLQTELWEATKVLKELRSKGTRSQNDY